MRRLTWIVCLLLVIASVAGPAPAASGGDAKKQAIASQKAKAGLKALERGDAEGARKRFDKAIEMVAYQPDAHLGLGHLQMREQKFDEALASYRQAREGYLQLATAQQDQQAKQDLRRQKELVDLRATSGAAGGTKQSAGYARTQALRRETAMKNAERADRYGTRDEVEVPGTLHFFTGTALFQLQRYEEAIEEWETCVEKTPEFGPVYNNLALVYWKLGRPSVALENLASAEKHGVNVNPDFKAELTRTVASKSP